MRAVPLLTAKPAKRGFVSKAPEPFSLFMAYEFIREAYDLKLTREIIVIVGEKGKCHEALTDKEREEDKKGSDCRRTSQYKGFLPVTWPAYP